MGIDNLFFIVNNEKEPKSSLSLSEKFISNLPEETFVKKDSYPQDKGKVERGIRNLADY